MDIESKHFSMVSPVPGNTPPEMEKTNEVIKNFLKANNVPEGSREQSRSGSEMQSSGLQS